ncbi:copper chaperone for superoxide dismutase-like isoform X1 [Tetranychus urticae]|nr:copper chaperone for superoxide dismutase-like isoform X1 [Tetranychus urticae]
MAAKVELNCEMTCDNCANKIRQALNGLTGITIHSIDVTKQQVLIEVAENAELTIPDLQNQIEDKTGLRTVIKGIGEGLATVSEFNGPDDLIGVIRLAQLSDNRCLVDGVIDHIKLSSETNHCRLDIHEFGDLRNIDNVGPVKVPVLDKVKPIARRCLFRGNFDNCDLSNVIGRSLVIKEQESNRKLSAAIIARVSPIYGNDKKICSCSGKTIWDERDEKRQSI